MVWPVHHPTDASDRCIVDDSAYISAFYDERGIWAYIHMPVFEKLLLGAVICSTVISITLLLLPSSVAGNDDSLDRGRKSHVRIQVLVLGDIGRSPRMQYHALSIAKHGGIVDLIGYQGEGQHFQALTSIGADVRELKTLSYIQIFHPILQFQFIQSSQPPGI